MTDRNVLIIDDSGTIRQGINLVLRQAHLFDHYFEAAGAREGLEILKSQRIELVLVDIVMPGMDGFEFVSEMKGIEEFKDIPVIMLTGQESVDKKIKGLDLGASDYLTKPFDPGELIARVRVQMKIKKLQDELKNAKQRYKELSISDFLTGIYNRRHFMETLDLEFSRASRHRHELSLIIFDVDNFKQVNDTQGHLTGDRVLHEMAEIVRGEIRTTDIFARYGGEEFVILLPQTPLAGALLVAEKVRDRIEKADIAGLGPGSVTVSGGVSSFPCESVLDVKSLIHQADAALYRAKDLGKNRTESVQMPKTEE